MEILSTNRSYGGTQGVYRHQSSATGTEMTFAVYVPAHAPGAKLPVLWYLSGLTCTHANVMEKGEYRRACAEHGIVFVAPDTSPRGDEVPDDEGYDFGQGAGFYVDATEEPWARHFRMRLHRTRAARAARRRVPRGHGSPGDHRPFDGRARRADHLAAQSRPFQVDQRLRPDREPAELPVGRKGARRLSRDRPGRLARIRRLRADRGRRPPARPAGRPGHRRQLPVRTAQD